MLLFGGGGGGSSKSNTTKNVTKTSTRIRDIGLTGKQFVQVAERLTGQLNFQTQANAAVITQQLNSANAVVSGVEGTLNTIASRGAGVPTEAEQARGKETLNTTVVALGGVAALATILAFKGK